MARAERAGLSAATRSAQAEAVRCFYTAKALMESGRGAEGRGESAEEALKLLLRVKELTPGFRGIDDEIAACHRMTRGE